MPVGMSSAVKGLMGKASGSLNRAVTGLAGMAERRGTIYAHRATQSMYQDMMINNAAKSSIRTQAYSAGEKAARFVAKHPKGTIGAGVGAVGAYGGMRRRGSQNYPMY